MKKFYQTPAMQVVAIQTVAIMQATVNGIGGNAGMKWGGGSDGSSEQGGGARSQGFGGFLEDDTEE